MTDINVDIVQHTYMSGGTPVLRDVRFQVKKGEIVSLVGPSGAGKSTLLNIIGGLLVPANGSVTFSNNGVACETPRVGYVFQSPRLMPWLSASENISLVLSEKNLETPFATQLLKQVGLSA